MACIARSLVLFVTSVALAQEPLRDHAFGLVRDAAGKPWADATVSLLHRAHAGVFDERYCDSLTVKTDERGRFRAQLLAGMPYMVSARSSVEAGRYRCTEVLTGITPGVPIILNEQASRFTREFSLQVHESWPKSLRVFARTRIGSEQLQVELFANGEGHYTTPFWPVDYVVLSIMEEGIEVSASMLQTTEERVRRFGAYPGGPKHAEDEDVAALMRQAVGLVVGKRHDWAVRLVGHDGKPVVAAEVRAESKPPRSLIGTSDADGVLHVITAASDAYKMPYRSVVLAAECAEAEFGREVLEKAIAAQLAKEPLPTVTLSAGRTVTGRLRLDADTPMASAPIVLQGSIGTGPGSTWFGVDPRVFRSQSDGSFRIPGRTDAYPFRLSLVLSPSDRARLAAGQDDAPPIWPLALLVPEKQGKHHDLGDIRVDQLRALDIAVLAHDGSPPGSVRLVVAPLQGMRNQPQEPDVVHTDRRGRVRILTRKCGQLLVHATTPKGVAWAAVDDKQSRVDLRIDPAHAVRFRVMDSGRKPVGGASVGLVAPSDLASQRDADGDEVQMRARVRGWCMVHAVPFKSGTTDGDGYVELVMPCVDVQLDIFVSERKTGKEKRIEVEFLRERAAGAIVLDF